MSSVRSSSSAGDSVLKDLEQSGRLGEVIKTGYLKKMKSGTTALSRIMKRKFVVLRGETADTSARLEYYDNEKKFKTNQLPKKIIPLRTCFNINRRTDLGKIKYVISLYTKDNVFTFALDSEDELEEWLGLLLSLQQGEDIVDGEPPKPTFEHVWQVKIQKKGLGTTRNILGSFMLCLTDKKLSLVRKTLEENPETYEFSLMSIRRCGHSDCFFYMEVGRSSVTGAGDLWMETEDPNIAQNMHGAILSAMSCSRDKEKDKEKDKDKDDTGPRHRTRSSSATEASRPITMNTRKTSHLPTMKPSSYYSTSEEANRVQSTATAPTAAYTEHPAMSPSASGALPNQVCVGSLPGSYHNRVAPTHHPPVPTPPVRPSQRRHSVSAMSVSSMIGAGGGPTHQRTYSLPLCEPSGPAPGPAPGPALSRKRGSSSGRSSTAAGRERCDSLPSRARTTSEGHPQPPPHAPRGVHLVPGRPHSMYTRGVSYSPPVGSSPVSPASGACSTDSAGSSLSIDDAGDGWSEEGIIGMGRYSTSLTPDEPAILEVEEYTHWPGPGSGGNGDSNYLPMDRSHASLSLPIHACASVTTVTAAHRKISPNLSSSGFKSGSPSQGSYMEMYSPCGSSPMENTGGYMAMSPGGGGGSAPLEATPRMQIYPRAASSSSANHSRGSSLAEDGYVPMAPSLTDDGYVDMDPMHPSHGNENFHPSDMSPASSCSITSGTPSTDLRFSEYHLEKVTSYFTPSEEDETSSLDRPIPRAYSVGSRPDNFKKPIRLEGQNQAVDAASRVRAFSVGSRGPPGGKGHAISGPSSNQHHHPSLGGATLTPPGHHHLHPALAPSASGSKKSSSAPLLSNSWSGSGSSSLRQGPHSSHSSVEPMDDLMEMDFTRTPRSSTKNSLKSVSQKSGGLPPQHQSQSNQEKQSYMDLNARTAGPGKPFAAPTGPYLEMRPVPPHSASPPSSNSVSRSPKSSLNSASYVEMRPGAVSDSPDSRPITVQASSSGINVSPQTRVSVTPYAEMRSVTVGSLSSGSPSARSQLVTPGSTPASEEVPYIPMKPGSMNSESAPFLFTKPIPVPVSAGPYMNMKPGNGGDAQPQNTTSATPQRPVATPTNVSPKSCSFNMGSYAEMSQFPTSASFSNNRQSSRKPASPIQEEYVDMNLKPSRKTSRQENSVVVLGSTVVNRTAPLDTPQPKKPPEGYMEMSWNQGSKSPPKSSMEDFRSPPSSHDDYMNISYENKCILSNKRKERRNSRKESRYSSQPIAIGGPPKEVTGKTSSASTSPVFSFIGRKSSSGTPPKIPPGFLPLGGSGSGGTSSPSSSPFSSLRRSRKTSGGSRRESGDGSSGLTTPTGSTTIFPLSLNSPGSPMKPFPGTGSSLKSLHSVPSVEGEMRKCPVDATSGTVRISFSYPEMELSASSTGSTPASPESSSSSEQPTPVNTESVDDIIKGDESDQHSYVNYCPRKTAQSGGTSKDDGFGDYASMRPVPVVRAGAHEATRKISAPTFGVMNRRLNNIYQGVAGLTLSSPTLNSAKTVQTSREATPPIARKSSFNSALPALAPLCKPTPTPPSGSSGSEVTNGPKVINSEDLNALSRQPSNASNSSRESKSSRQLSRSSSGSSEVGRSIEAGRAADDKSECMSVKSEDSGTISPASSQTAVASRPPSVSSERELHYASLDLAPSGSEGEDGARSPRSLKTQGSLTESSNSSPSPKPVHCTGGGDAFTYAEIDFSRRDAVKTPALTSNKKVRQ